MTCFPHVNLSEDILKDQNLFICHSLRLIMRDRFGIFTNRFNQILSHIYKVQINSIVEVDQKVADHIRISTICDLSDLKQQLKNHLTPISPNLVEQGTIQKFIKTLLF